MNRPRLRPIAIRWPKALAWLAVALFLLIAGGFTPAIETSPAADDLSLRVAAFDREHGGRPIGLAAIAPSLREAVVATEDERFYHHQGLDLIGLLRAVPYDLSHFSLAPGREHDPRTAGEAALPGRPRPFALAQG